MAFRHILAQLIHSSGSDAEASIHNIEPIGQFASKRQFLLSQQDGYAQSIFDFDNAFAQEPAGTNR